jgi:type VI protein secretion system component VasA
VRKDLSPRSRSYHLHRYVYRKQREGYEGYAVYEEYLAWAGATAFFEVFGVSELLNPHYGQILVLVIESTSYLPA